MAVWLGVSYAVAYRLTHRHGPVVAEPVPVVDWARFQAVRLRTSDGLDLGAWYASEDGPGPSVVLLHGNGGGRAGCLDQARFLAGAGCATLLVTLRAHGDSAGTRNDFGYSARLDVEAAVAWLERTRPGRPVVVIGRSLGSAAAAFASRSLGGRVRGYVLECPYRDLTTAVRNRTRRFLPRPLDLLAYVGLRAVAPLVVGDPGRIAPVDAVDGIPADVPVLILAGGLDDRARPEEAEAIFRRVAAHARFVVFERAGHLGLAASEPVRYRRVILDLINEAAAGRGRGGPSPSPDTPGS